MRPGNQFSLFSALILLLAALAIALFPTPAVVLVACLCGASVGVLILYLMTVGRRPAKLTEIMVAALLTGYCGGCAITQSFCGLDQHGIPYTSWAIVPPSWVSFTIALVLIACALLLVASWFEPRMFAVSEFIQVGRPEEWLIWTGVFLLLLEIFLGRFGYMGVAVQEGTGRVSILAEIAGSSIGIAFPLAAIAWMQSSGLRRFRFAVLGLLLLIVTVPTGRRALVYSVLVTVFSAAQLSGVRLSLSRQAKWMWGIIVPVGIFGATVVFLGLRMTVGNLGPGNHSLAEIVEQAGGVFENPSYLLTATEENLETRPFLLTQYLSLLTKGGNLPAPMYGADLKYYLEINVPDYIYHSFGRSKNNLRAIGGEEGLANEHFNLPVFDDANSVLTGSVIDLGLIGVAIYPIGACLLWRLLAVFVERFLGKKARFLFLLVALGTFLQAEVGLGGYLVSARGAFIVLAIWMALSALSNNLTLGGRTHVPLPKTPADLGLPLRHGSR
jgi:hypothetical protein